MTSQPNIKKPTSILNRAIKFDFIPIFKGISKGIAHVATGKIEELGTDLAESLAGLGLDTPAEELAYQLIKRALFHSVYELAEESISRLTLDESYGLPKLHAELENKLGNVSVTLNKNFLANPSQIDLIKKVVPLFSDWLENMGLTKYSADAVANRLPSYFVFAVTNEWRKNNASYKPILNFIDTPFELAESRESEWLNYFAMLKRRTQENIFDEAFSLAQIYIPLRAYFESKNSGPKIKEHLFDTRYEKTIVDLHSELIAWIKKKDKNDALRVISGGPGSGKSSFSKILCTTLTEKAIAKPIYIPLHLIDPTKDIIEEVAKYVRDEGFLTFNPLDSELQIENLVLVFDGLDELASQGKIAAQIAKDFVQAVERMVERRNIGHSPILVIICGRELVIQENETEFRRPKQILTILPYYISKEDLSEFKNSDNFKDDRDQWWINYGKLTGESFMGLPSNLKRAQIDEITAQPLLNYLVALSYSRKTIDFNKTLNLNYIYSDLVAAVHERAYERRTYKPISHIQLQEFVRVLEEIGLAAWHSSDGRSTSVNDILKHCEDSGLGNLVNTFQEGAKAGVTKLLAAFFFRKNGAESNGDATFVFTHKTFGEYLTSARIVRGIENIITQLERKRINVDDGFDLSEGLVKWVKLVGPAEITPYILTFLRQEIEQRDISLKQLWKRHLTHMMNHAIDFGMPMEKIASIPFHEATRQQNNASITLVIALNACAKTLKETIELNLSSENSFGTFLRRVCKQRVGPASPLIYKALSYFDFSGQCFDLIDLYSADLSYTKWKKCRINYASIWISDLAGADMTEAILTGTNFNRSTFVGANLSGAYCEEASFVGANFIDTNLEGAVLSDCKIQHAIFSKGTNLNATNFFNTKIYKVQRDNADFSNIDLVNNILERRISIEKEMQPPKAKMLRRIS